jgi:hypothetical protein
VDREAIVFGAVAAMFPRDVKRKMTVLQFAHGSFFSQAHGFGDAAHPKRAGHRRQTSLSHALVRKITIRTRVASH